MALLEGRVAIVTGGGRGIGREHCLELARHGASVVVVDPGVGLGGESTDDDPGNAVVDEIRTLGVDAFAIRGSVMDWATTEEVITQTVDRLGRLDALVNNAGIARDRMITSMSEDDFDLVVGVHLKGTFAMTKHACDYWRSSAKAGHGTGGRIINTTSGAGLSGNIGQSSYAASKAGIVGLTLTTALEMDRYGVTCNAISPVARTRMSADLPGAVSGQTNTAAFDPLHPGTTSPLVAYLASTASGWLSGQVLRVEGGTVIRMEGWRQGDERYSNGGDSLLSAEELASGLRRAYRAFPAGLTSTLTQARPT